MQSIIKIRFNTTYPSDGGKKWRVLIGDSEMQYDEIEIQCRAITTSDIIEKNGITEEKHHITCFSKKQMIYTKPKGVKILCLQ